MYRILLEDDIEKSTVDWKGRAVGNKLVTFDRHFARVRRQYLCKVFNLYKSPIKLSRKIAVRRKTMMGTMM